eukprot:scaffold7066_cov253-Pinguiococcus_pyrenoidosus.AAC.44
MRRGVETALAASWRKRYEHAVREKDRVASLLRLYHASGAMDDEEVEESEILDDKELLEAADIDAELDRSSNQELRARINELQSHFARYQKQVEELLRKEKERHALGLGSPPQSPRNGRSWGGPAENGAAKLAYIKNLLLQYWTSQDVRVSKCNMSWKQSRSARTVTSMHTHSLA